jgi:16S rRNA (uracil1498-N3)-methyltransferase
MRRVLVPSLRVGPVELPAEQSHHLARVLRLEVGAEVEVFDRAGAVGSATIAAIRGKNVILEIQTVRQPPPDRPVLAIASAIPKGQRADWMVEKLSELGIDRFIPLDTERGVVMPEGKQKPERWRRLAEESAEQSQRAGIMQIESARSLGQLIERAGNEGWAIWQLSLSTGSLPILQLVQKLPKQLLLLIGPEGGWTENEDSVCRAAGAIAVYLTATTLRIESAAIAAAAVVQSARSSS